MKAFIIQFPFGVVAFDDKNRLVEKVSVSEKTSGSSKKLA